MTSERNIRNPDTNISEDKRSVSEILKMDENNQYGNAMTKPHPTSSIKKIKNMPSHREFDTIIQSISDEDKIEHVVVVGIKFNKKNDDEKILLFNEIYAPIFEKKKLLSPNERPLFQLLDKGTLNSYKTTTKTHLKIFIPLYDEHLYFLLDRCEWVVTPIYAHHTFKQSKCKEVFVIVNQVSRQNAKNSVKKDFYKLMDNSNLGYDYRNNADNCISTPIFNEIEELSYTKRFQNVFH